MIEKERYQVTLPGVTPLGYVSPSSFERLAGCPLQVAYGRAHQDGGARSESPAQRLGTAAHRVVEWAAREERLREPPEPSWVADRWAAALAEQRAAAAVAGDLVRYGDPEAWADTIITEARLRRLLRRLAEWAAALGVQPLPEQELQSSDGRLRGVVDLIARASTGTYLADVKTGRIEDRASGDLKAAYVSQLHIYAYLEHEVSGTWPRDLRLEPLAGSTQVIAADAAIAQNLAEEALTALNGFNESLPMVEARPDAAVCAFCPHLARCPAVWKAANPEWERNVIRGHVLERRDHENGTTTLVVSLDAGTMPLDGRNPITVRSMSPVEHAQVVALEPGDAVALSGVVQERDRDTFMLAAWGLLTRMSHNLE